MTAQQLASLALVLGLRVAREVWEKQEKGFVVS